uniref:NADH-ubiquinone oxidoreductase chain 6 n=1 Tax=Paragnetina indentata TaxID=2810020 RepID=A0A890CIJ7_9NEOP|nr:NADH dehydrogenase subunit 6 [Paragnetina indentata]QRG31740.1 NADH dehydrogenase subunit 6 [Paragnetina indentata]
MLNLFLMFSSSILAFIFTQMSHPLAMGLMLLLQTFLVTLIAGFLTQSFWFSYILFLVFLGGLLVLFIYVTSLASNEMFSLSLLTLLSALIPLSLAWIIFIALDPFALTHSTMNIDLQASVAQPHHLETAFPLMKLYNNPTNLLTLMLVLYLFLTLIAVVKVTSILKGPLRLKN